MGSYFILVVLISLFFLNLALSQKIVVNVLESLNFSIVNYTKLENKNFFGYNAYVYNTGSKSFKAKLFLESDCCKIYSEENILNPSEEKFFSIYYLSLRNESINISLIVDNLNIPIGRFLFNFSEILNVTEKNLDYIFENGKLKILGNLDNYHFFILNHSTTQKKLNKNYNEIEIKNFQLEKIDVLFFNETEFFIKSFELKNPNIFKKVLFEIKKILTLAFSI